MVRFPNNKEPLAGPTEALAEERPLPASCASSTAPFRKGTATDALAGRRAQRGAAPRGGGRRRDIPASSRDLAVLPKSPEDDC